MLRPYQSEAIEYARHWLKDNRTICIQMPTGSGKTVLFADMCNRIARSGKTICVLANRLPLISQAADTFKRAGLKPVVYDSKVPTYVSQLPKHCIASAATLKRRQLYPMHDFVFVDECHLSDFDNLIKFAGKVIGLTATPWRAGGTPLKDIYDHVYQGPLVNDLIADGYLKPAMIYSSPIDSKGLRKVAGEYSEASQERVLMKRANLDSLYANWLKYRGKASIVFAPTVKASQDICDYFNERGHKFRHIDGSTPKDERTEIDRQLRDGEIDGIANCAVLTFGYDNPIIDTVVINRATTSLALWLQMCGRGSRPYGEKTHFVVLDCGDNVSRHGHWQAEIDWLPYFNGDNQDEEQADKERLASIITCEQCFYVYESGPTECPQCGYKKQVKQKVKEVAKDLVLVDFLDTPHKAINFADKSIEELLSYQQQKQYKIGWLVRIVKQTHPDPVQSLKEIARLKGYADGWVHRMLTIGQ